ncbi:dihydroorotate dehydrogenase-like protein [Synechococcus sp. RSCCF101]|uniref:dihydroorotate dehydrogenase-like protein n=1 Tax=Synechococcus sp. RSCCF101 TaxID=2511069 RepID=UPI001248593F|nr:dihydroorotate dehydrogenase-like protein [Synechococcus sp. RSCCF101]QEY33062.1 dihydroorotate dehydrogenase-like protein [Synechococcus sp. RSCCF101]
MTTTTPGPAGPQQHDAFGPDLSVEYLGLRLANPLVVGAAAPLSESPEALPALEAAGAGAVVLHSLFQEEIEREQMMLHSHWMQGAESYAEALSYLPEESAVHGGEDLYLRDVEEARRRLSIPVIASLNGLHPGSWVHTARRIEAAGASALELNVYSVPTDPGLSSEAIEQELVSLVADVRRDTRLPLAVKLGPYYTNLSALARRLAEAGADALVLFNRFYQPDIDIETLEIRPNLILSNSHELRLPLRWIALLHGRVPMDLAASGGVQRGADVVRLLMAGASVTQVVGALLRHGPARLSLLRRELSDWLHQHEYASARSLIGCMSQRRCPEPSAFERAQYVRALHSLHAGPHA